MDYLGKKMQGVMAGAWIEVDLDALSHNFQVVRNLAGNETKVCAVVKADAYGHGVARIAPALEKAGVDYFAVAILDEAIELRKTGITGPVLILGPLMPGHAEYVLRYNLTQTVCSLDMAEELSNEAFRQKKKAKIHVKVDTGMGRIGVNHDSAVSLISEISTLPFIEIEGIFTHFATADSKEKEYVSEQHEIFNRILNDLKALGINIPIAHCATSSTLIDLPEMKMDMVRTGLMLYGIYPRKDQSEKVSLKPALTYKARISFLKEITEKRSISYGRKYFAESGEKIATLPIGYNDGIRRILTNRGNVLIGGKICPMVGTVCMDHVMIDVSEVKNVARYDEAVLIGRQGNEEITVDDMADNVSTINYEILSTLGSRLPRIYKSGGKWVAVKNLLGHSPIEIVSGIENGEEEPVLVLAGSIK